MRLPEEADRKKFRCYDPDSRIMVNGDHAFIQGYNAQAAVDDAHQIIVGRRVTHEANGKRQVTPLTEDVEANTAKAPGKASADSGYFSEGNVAYLEGEGTDPYIPPTRDRKLQALPPPRGRIPKGLSPADRMRRKLRTQKGRAPTFVLSPHPCHLCDPWWRVLDAGCGPLRGRVKGRGSRVKGQVEEAEFVAIRRRRGFGGQVRADSWLSAGCGSGRLGGEAAGEVDEGTEGVVDGLGVGEGSAILFILLSCPFRAVFLAALRLGERGLRRVECRGARFERRGRQRQREEEGRTQRREDAKEDAGYGGGWVSRGACGGRAGRGAR